MRTPRFFPIAVLLSTLSLTAPSERLRQVQRAACSRLRRLRRRGSGGSGGGGGLGHPPGASLVITPADVTIDVVNGDVAGKSVSFKVEAKQAHGTYISVNNCQWTLENVDVGSPTARRSGRPARRAARPRSRAPWSDTAVAKVRVNLATSTTPPGSIKRRSTGSWLDGGRPKRLSCSIRTTAPSSRARSRRRPS